MNCNKHEELYSLLVRIDERTHNTEANLKELIKRFDKYEETCETKSNSKVSKWSFVLVLSICGGIMGYSITQINTLDAKFWRYEQDIQFVKTEILKFKDGVNKCDFTNFEGD